MLTNPHIWQCWLHVYPTTQLKLNVCTNIANSCTLSNGILQIRLHRSILSKLSLLTLCFPEGEAYSDARMPNWPHRFCTPAQDQITGPASEQGGFFEAGNLSALISPLLTGMCEWCNYTLPFLDLRFSGCHMSLK